MSRKIKILGGHQGQFGDCCMATVLARSVKNQFPESEFIYTINKKFWGASDLFLNHCFIDRVLMLDGYDDFPTKSDVEKIRNENPDIFLHPMPKHPNDHCWFNLCPHQTAAMCVMNGMMPPLDLKCYLNKYFNIIPKKNAVCISPFSMWERKNVSLDKWVEIVRYLKSKGFDVIQIGSNTDSEIPGAVKANTKYSESIKEALACKFVIGLDGGVSWFMSAYSHPFIGLYGNSYDGIINPKFYQPINENAVYIYKQNPNDIDLDSIFNAIDNFI